MQSQCPGCGTLYKITQAHLGRQTQCKKCGHRFVIEVVSSETPPPVTQPQSDPQPPSYANQDALPEKEAAAAPEVKMTMQSQCPGCGALYHITPEHLGQSIQCQNCRHNFVIETVSNGDPKPVVQPLSTPQPQAQPLVDQASQMIQVTCQSCGTVNQMPPGVACNCGRCGQPLPVSAPSAQLYAAQAPPQGTAQPQPTTQTQSAETSKLAVGQILSSAFSTVIKNPATFFWLAITASAPAVLFLIRFANEFKDKDDFVLTSIEIAINSISFMVMEAWVVYAVFKILRQETITDDQAQEFSRDHMGTLLGASILVGLAVGLGTIVFVIPGVILMVMLAMTIPACAFEGLGVVASMKRSARLTAGHRLPIFGLYLISSFILGGCAFLFDLILNSLAIGFEAYTILSALLNALPTAFETVMTAVLYFKLREIKEGVALDSLAGAFELNQENESAGATS